MRHRATPGRSSGQPRQRPHEITHPSPPQPANPPCTCPSTGPANSSGKPCGTTSSATRPSSHAPPDPTHQSLSTPAIQARPKEPKGKAGTGQQITHAHRVHAAPNPANHGSQSPIHGIRLRTLELTLPNCFTATWTVSVRRVATAARQISAVQTVFDQLHRVIAAGLPGTFARLPRTVNQLLKGKRQWAREITTQPRTGAGILPPWRSAGAMRLRSSGNYTHSVAGLADSWSLPPIRSVCRRIEERPCEVDLPERRRRQPAPQLLLG